MALSSVKNDLEHVTATDKCAEDTLPSSSSRVAPKWLPQESKGSDSFLPSAPPPDDEEGFAVPVAGVNQQQPPSYNSEGNEAPPPSYDSLYGAVREIRNTSSGICDFIKKLLLFLFEKVSSLIVIGVVIILPISMIVVGSYYVYDCPAEKLIPVFLIVGGIFSILCIFFESLLYLLCFFLFCWFFAGCSWVYSAYEPNFVDPLARNYCNYTLYTFAFWVLNSVYIFIGVSVLTCCCMSAYYWVFPSTVPD